MSGHSQFSNIKIRKEAQDAKRAKIFSKLSLVIYTAAKQGGVNVDTNIALRSAIEKAREANMPKDKIDKAVSKASPSSKAIYEELTYEFYGPSATAFIVKCLTDNRNRTINNIKAVLNDFNLTLSSPGSAMYNFDTKPDTQLEPKFLVTVDAPTKQKIDEICDAFLELEDVLDITHNAN